VLNHIRTKDYKYNAGHTKDYNWNAGLGNHDANLSRSSCRWATGCEMHCGCLCIMGVSCSDKRIDEWKLAVPILRRIPLKLCILIKLHYTISIKKAGSAGVPSQVLYTTLSSSVLYLRAALPPFARQIWNSVW